MKGKYKKTVRFADNNEIYLIIKKNNLKSNKNEPENKVKKVKEH